MRKLLTIVLVAAMTILSACNEETQFVQRSYVAAGMGSNGGGVSLTPTPTPNTGNNGGNEPEYRTTITMVTQRIINNAANQFLEVQVAYEGPSGNPADFPFDELRFDMASVTASDIHPLAYEVHVSNALDYNGVLDEVWGEDLFGNIGSNYFYFATDQLLDIPRGVTWFKFRVDLSYSEHHPYGQSTPYPHEEQIQVYVKFGGDSMLASAPVTFVN